MDTDSISPSPIPSTGAASISPPKVTSSNLFFMPMRLLLNHVMEYTNPLLGLTGSRIASAPDAVAAVPSVPTPAESSLGEPQLEGSIPVSTSSNTGNGGAKKAQKMRPSKTTTAR